MELNGTDVTFAKRTNSQFYRHHQHRLLNTHQQEYCILYLNTVQIRAAVCTGTQPKQPQDQPKTL
jgi:hypothetical protein